MKLIAAVGAMLLAACQGGSGLETGGCDGHCSDTPTSLSVADVEQIIAQAAQEAAVRSALATVAVVDRVGNVLGVFQMTGADPALTVSSNRGVATGLDGVSVVPSTLGAIAKAITGAYLSSEGNAFSTRTASQIVQEHFFPREFNQPGGPLFGVQFSQLPCSDLSARFGGTRPSPGPHRSPLGLAADAGGLPLYKNGVPVGGIGVLADGVYGLDPDLSDRDTNLDEIIALAGSAGFEAPLDRRGDRITVDGKPLRFSDALPSDLAANPAAATFAAASALGALLTVPGYMNSNAIAAGTAFGTPASGIRAADTALGDPAAFEAGDGFVLVDGANANRYPPSAGAVLSAAEVRQILASALAVANRSRAQIRRPYGTAARVTISVTDTDGGVLGIVRTRDAPVFGTDVSLQKARTALFFSSANAAGDLTGLSANYLSGGSVTLSDYTTALRAFLGQPNALADGAIAYSNRAIGLLARPYFPDGLRGSNNGPLSKPFSDWSPFSTGLQLDLVHDAIVQHVTFVLGGGTDVAAGACTSPAARSRLANGMQIFPGAAPIYKLGTLAGAIGISGDGIDQDDMVGFLGLFEAGEILGALGHAPAAIRADQLAPQNVRLRYVQCPQAPFISSGAQNVCENK